MNVLPQSKKEQLATQLQELMASRGFQHLPISKFEEYDVYVDNKNFLATEHIVTFTDPSGRLLSIKPDSTISIARKIPTQPMPGFQKVYYRDEVLRVTKEYNAYQMIDQVGVEIMGPIDTFANIEIVDLALSSLGLISEDYVLDISHNGFVRGLLEMAGLGHSEQKKALAAIHQKSSHGLKNILTQAGVSSLEQEDILRLANVTGPFTEVLSKLKPLVQGPLMEQAYEELLAIGESLSLLENSKKVHLDFSAVGELEYYNGIVLVGYIKESPQEVLKGGRYDKLLQRMKKENGAVGFAISLSQIPDPPATSPYDFDCLILYRDSTHAASLLEIVHQMNLKGKRVRCEPYSAQKEPFDFTYKTAYIYNDMLTKREEPLC